MSPSETTLPMSASESSAGLTTFLMARIAEVKAATGAVKAISADGEGRPGDSSVASPRPMRSRDIVGKIRRPVAAELISDLERIYQRKKAASKELKEGVAETGTTLLDLHEAGPSGPARLLVEVGDITRFPNRAHFTSWNDTPPATIDPSSGPCQQDQAA